MQIKIDTVSNVFSITRNDFSVTGNVRPDPVFEPAGSMTAQTMATMRTIAKLVLSEDDPAQALQIFDDATRTYPVARRTHCNTHEQPVPAAFSKSASTQILADHSDRSNGYAPFNAKTYIGDDRNCQIEVYRPDCACEYCEDTREHHGWELLKGAQCKSN